MAFGFGEAVTGLIVGRGEGTRAERFGIDFAREFVDRLIIVADLEEARAAVAAYDRTPAMLMFGEGNSGRDRAAFLALQYVPFFANAALRHAAPSAARTAMRATEKCVPVRVCLFGPESTGKSTLAEVLAAHYRCPLATEYARAFLDSIGSAGTLDDLEWIARGQRATEAAAALHADHLLVCDTNLATIALWSEILYDVTAEWISAAAANDHYELWLLTGIDIPFEPDPQRCFPEPEQREWFMTRCRQALAAIGVVPIELRGDSPARLAVACAAIDRMLESRRASRL